MASHVLTQLRASRDMAPDAITLYGQLRDAATALNGYAETILREGKRGHRSTPALRAARRAAKYALRSVELYEAVS